VCSFTKELYILSEATVEKLCSGIVRVIYPKKGLITLDMFHNIYAQIRQLANTPVAIMIIGQRVHYIEYGALELTTKPEINAFISAQAIVTKTRLECLLGKLYLKTHPTNYPSRCFASEDEAQHWLLNEA
jgi:hypothetical protein